MSSEFVGYYTDLINTLKKEPGYGTVKTKLDAIRDILEEQIYEWETKGPNNNYMYDRIDEYKNDVKTIFSIQDYFREVWFNCSNCEIQNDLISCYNTYDIKYTDLYYKDMFNDLKKKDIDSINTQLDNIHKEVFSKLYLKNEQGEYKMLTDEEKKFIIEKLDIFKDSRIINSIKMKIVKNEIYNEFYSINHNKEYEKLTDINKEDFIGKLNVAKKMKEYFNKI